MAGTQVKPKCQWCGKDCKPKYELVCDVCHHPSFKHRISEQDGRKSCSAEGCVCPIVYRWDKEAQGFSKVLLGYGIFEDGLFCSKTCAVYWATKYAPQVTDIRACLRQCGIKMNPPETVAGAVRNLAQVVVSHEEVANKP